MNSMKDYDLTKYVKCLFSFSFFRYVLTGGILYGIDLGAFLFCCKVLGLNIMLSQGIARTLGAIVGFFGHKYFSFGNKKLEDGFYSMASQGGKYLFVTVFNVFFSPFLVYAFAWVFSGHLIVTKVVAEIILVIETYFLLRLIFLSTRKEEKKQGANLVK
jgi:putative flippase GtrA